MAIRVGVQINGLPAAEKVLSDLQHKAGLWARTRIGVEVRVPYAYWIEHGRYFSGRPGSFAGYHYAEQATREILPSIGPEVAKSLSPRGDPSKTAEQLSTRLRDSMRARQPSQSGRLRRETVVFRGGGLRNL